MIDIAKKNGSWTALKEIEKMTVPDDLAKAFIRNKRALKHFEAFPPSSKKIILHWIQNAKTEETRTKRIKETVRMAAKNERANHYVPKSGR
jgi:uncharacterized protein YdeI (YjbR/CyaY-like superfamily)